MNFFSDASKIGAERGKNSQLLPLRKKIFYTFMQL